MKTNFSRRQFLGAAATTAVAAPLIIPRSVLGQNGNPGANDSVKVGIIGYGGRMRSMYTNDTKPVAGFKLAGICDFWTARTALFMNDHPDDLRPNQVYSDFRKMIENEKLDAVMAMTATHQRAWVSSIAMQMGCHLFIEKAMCLTIEEGRHLVNCARKYNRVTQVGSQQRSLPLPIWACEQVQKGVIGKVHTVIAPNFVGPNYWEDRPAQPFPEGMNAESWDMWTNQVVLRPYHVDLFRGWARWWDYEGGGLTFGVSGWGTHSYDQVNMALGTSETGPVRIRLDEETAIRPSGRPEEATELEELPDPDADTGTQYHHMARHAGPRAAMTMWFDGGADGGGIELRLNLDGDRGPGLGCIVRGENGAIEINRHRISSNPREIVNNMPEELRAQNEARRHARPETIYHIENWIDCIKTGEKCTADVEYGQRATTMCELVNIVRTTCSPDRVGEIIHWDPVNERFTNNDKGNEMLSRPRRKGYELPDLT